MKRGVIVSASLLVSACGPETFALYRVQTPVVNLCTPSDFVIRVGAQRACSVAAIRVSELEGPKPCLASVDLGLDGDVDSTFGIDAHGHPIDSLETHYDVRSDGQVARAVLDEQRPGENEIVYTYDPEGRAQRAAFGDLTVSFVWSRGRLMEEVAGESRMVHVYARGRRVALRMASLGGPLRDVRRFVYDGEGRLRRVENVEADPDDPVVYAYTYGRDEIRITKTSTTGADPTSTSPLQVYAFDGGRLASIARDTDGDGALDRVTTYTYCDASPGGSPPGAGDG